MRTKLSLDNNSGLSYLTYPSSINDEIKINKSFFTICDIHSIIPP